MAWKATASRGTPHLPLQLSDTQVTYYWSASMENIRVMLRDRENPPTFITENGNDQLRCCVVVGTDGFVVYQ